MDECLCRNQKTKDDIVLPVAYLVCNQTPPIADKPSLMSFEEVETLFHEFGHVMPENIPVNDAVINLGALTLLLQGLRTGNEDLIADGMHDKLHEP